MPPVPDLWLKSVVHLYLTEADADAGSPYGGTAFLVSVRGVEIELPRPMRSLLELGQAEHDVSLASSLYVVTVNHNLTGGATVLRFNTHPTVPEPFLMPTDINDWSRDEDNDLAVLPIELDASRVDFTAVPATRLAPTDDAYLGLSVYPGSEVFMVGRFVEESGRAHNEVQVRFGNISMMPGEPINTEVGPVVAYLAEMRSRSGFSGSPVFHFRPAYGAVLRGTDGMGRASLIGVDQGHYKTLLPVEGMDGKVISGFRVRERSALSVVVPAGPLIHLLMAKEWLQMRKEKQGKHSERPVAVADSARREQGKDAALSKREFEDALGKVARKVDPPTEQAPDQA